MWATPGPPSSTTRFTPPASCPWTARASAPLRSSTAWPPSGTLWQWRGTSCRTPSTTCFLPRPTAAKRKGRSHGNPAATLSTESWLNLALSGSDSFPPYLLSERTITFGTNVGLFGVRCLSRKT
ncbi:unnamed protein product [Effrenium voratum]|uniref:Uncharacterized protein n=1 Tax=Effrenium voratum TaxID=2562239 RepID=A0AA36NAV9_9DINO|nr:unnamed protein product [Effrenium voratum]